ncbi:MAG: isoprenyl transferase [Verrucomicrobia bacterium]|nr:isoprenyl transferase [Verrucomicrobiota bacterium]
MSVKIPTLSEKAKTHLPKHIAIIMDGNGRWAQKRGLPRVEGHRNGIESVRTVVELCGELHINYLTLYAFSMENWIRPKDEVNMLMKYLAWFLKKETPDLQKNNVRLRAIGRLDLLPQEAQEQLALSIETLKNNTGLTLILALSYSSREEITHTVRNLARQVQAGQLDPEQIDEKLLSNSLYTKEYPDPDILIRTSGEMRISNFLLWQISYAELYVTPTLWPDFKEEDLCNALEEFAKRNRRFGDVK